MKSHTSLVAQQTRLSEWAELVRDCQNRLYISDKLTILHGQSDQL